MLDQAYHRVESLQQSVGLPGIEVVENLQGIAGERLPHLLHLGYPAVGQLHAQDIEGFNGALVIEAVLIESLQFQAVVVGGDGIQMVGAQKQLQLALLLLGEVLLVLQPQIAGPFQRPDLLPVLGTHLPAPDLVYRVTHHLDDVELVHRSPCLGEYVRHGIAVAVAHVAGHVLYLVRLSLLGLEGVQELLHRILAFSFHRRQYPGLRTVLLRMC